MPLQKCETRIKEKKQVAGYILDLRSNPAYSSPVEIAQMWLKTARLSQLLTGGKKTLKVQPPPLDG